MLRKFLRPRNLIILLVLALVIAGGVWAYPQLVPPSRGPALATVQRGDLSAVVNANGRVRSKQSARLSLPVAGIIARVNVVEGSTVQAKQVLLELDNTETQRRVRQAEINVDTRQRDYDRALAAPSAQDLDAAQAILKKAAIALAAAEKNYKDNATNANQAAKEITQIDYDNAKANFNRVAQGTSADDLKNLANNLEFSKLDLESNRRALEQTRITAPFAGIVTEVNAHVNELVGGFTPLITLADTTNLEILAQVDEVDVANVAVGQNAEASLDAFPGKTFKGKVTRLYPAANTERGSTVYNAIVEFSPGEALVRPGMGVTLRITTVEKKGALFVPARAVKNAGSQKFVIQMQNGQRREVVVEVGVTTGNQTEIVSGLHEGDQVVSE